jgi:probable phosphoglycerate mutase
MAEIKRPTSLVLVRHAESARNKAKNGTIYFADEEARRTVRGVPDHKIGITEEGVIQARKTGGYLRERFGAPDYVYHSGYERTIQTANEILKAYPPQALEKICVRMNPFIRERDPGYTYDMTAQEVAAAFPHLDEYWQTFGGFFARPPGGESLADVAERIYTFLNMLFRDRAGKKVWVVLHGGTLRAMRFLLERWSYEQATHWPPGQSPENCGITVYQYDSGEGRLLLKEYNTVAWR